MFDRHLKWLGSGVVIAAIFGCAGEKHDSNTAPDANTEQCTDFSGAYVAPSWADCNDPYFLPPEGGCLVQQGCDVTLETNQETLTGKVEGDTLTVTTTVDLGEFTGQKTCTGTKLEDGTFNLDCTTTFDVRPNVTCTVPFEKASLPPDATSVCCNYSAQNCGDGYRCVPELIANDHELLVPTCLPVGSKGPGEACERQDLGETQSVGHDDCGPAMHCIAFPEFLTTFRTCHQVCASTADCPERWGCRLIGVGNAPAVGVCEPRCTIFGSNSCPDETTCRYFVGLDEKAQGVYQPYCEVTGYGVEGEECFTSLQCSDGLTCEGRCVRYCDNQHPCANGVTCQKYGRLSIGFCDG